MRIPRRGLGLGILVCLATGLPALGAEKLRVLIIDGQNNHAWEATTAVVRQVLEKSGRFSVDVATSPAKDAPSSAWDKFAPDFSKYDVVLSNYNGQRWPERVEKSLERYIDGGGGLVIVHAANNAFPEWIEWNKMIGLGWRDSSYGDRVTVDDDGKVVRTPKGEGPGSSHGPMRPFEIVVREPSHPVTKGMPTKWLHAKDELYHGQRGPAEHMTILATAFSDKTKGGTGTNEPMIWVIPYGKGRVFTTLMGHTGGDEVEAVRCTGFQTVVARGTEWAATGEVTLPIPSDFPTADEVRITPR
jgi:type 1 glutamine amidotransferase